MIWIIKTKKYREKQCGLAEKRLEKATENVVVHSLEIHDMTKAFDSIILMNNQSNTISNVCEIDDGELSSVFTYEVYFESI